MVTKAPAAIQADIQAAGVQLQTLIPVLAGFADTAAAPAITKVVDAIETALETLVTDLFGKAAGAAISPAEQAIGQQVINTLLSILQTWSGQIGTGVVPSLPPAAH